jgi:signal transduction histidine kinase
LKKFEITLFLGQTKSWAHLKKIRYQLVFIVVFIFIFLSFKGSGQTAKIDSLRGLIPGLNGEKLCEAYLGLAKAYRFVDPGQMIYYADLALPIALETGNQKQEGTAYLRLGAGYIFSGDFEKGRQFSDKALSIAKEIDDKELVMSALNSLAAYHMNLGEYSESLDLFRNALNMAKEAGLEKSVAMIQLNIGAVLTAQGDRTNGLLHLFEALKYYEGTDERQTLARILNNIAVNYHYWKDYDRALEYYRQTLDVYGSLKDDVGQVVVLNNIGEIYKDKKDFKTAISYYNQVVAITDKSNIGVYYKAYGWIGLAEAYMQMDKVEKSLEYVSKALAVFENVKMQEGIANANLILAQLSLKQDKIEAALKQVNLCIQLAKSAGTIDLEQKAYLVRSQIYYKTQRYKAAYNDFQNYATISDTLYARELNENFADIRSGMEVTLKQHEIDLLQKDNQIKDLKIKRQHSSTIILLLIVLSLFIVSLVMLGYVKSRKKVNELLTGKNLQIREQHEELLRVNETKDKFMSIISHDLRNPIGAFKDVVGQLADYPEMFNEVLRQQIIEELREEAENTYFLLDNLLSWAKNQKAAISYKPEKLDIQRVVKNSIQLNSRLSEAKSIRLTSEMEGNLVAFADHNMINLVLRNLISNAIKFTANGGQIRVNVQEEGEMLSISVKDSGVGISEADLSSVFDPSRHLSTYGTNHEKGSGLGLLLCKEFVEINGGTITVESQQGEGSTFTFTLRKFIGQV